MSTTDNNDELAKRINNIIERFAKKVDSLNYQNISYNQKARQQAKNEIQREANRYAQKMIIAELSRTIPNVDSKSSVGYEYDYWW